MGIPETEYEKKFTMLCKMDIYGSMKSCDSAIKKEVNETIKHKNIGSQSYGIGKMPQKVRFVQKKTNSFASVKEKEYNAFLNLYERKIFKDAEFKVLIRVWNLHSILIVGAGRITRTSKVIFDIKRSENMNNDK